VQHTIVLIIEKYNIFPNGNYILQLRSLIKPVFWNFFAA